MRLIRNLLILFIASGVVAFGLLILASAYFRTIRESNIGPGSPIANISPVERLYFQHYLYQNREALSAPAGSFSQPLDFTIEPGETGNSIAQRLALAGIVSDADLFIRYARYNGLDSQFEAGTFELTPAMDTQMMALTLTDARPTDVTLTFLEGWRIEESARYLRNFQPAEIDPDRFLSIARRETAIDLSPYSFLNGLPQFATLEGYLFPDTYTLPLDATEEDLINLMLTTFDQRVTPEMRQAYGNQNISLREAVILASIIEREAVLNREKPLMASVFYNRLAAGMPFEADPTVQYAVGYFEETDTWWKSPLTFEDLRINNFYNTYVYSGFMPGPIAGPGFASLNAVAAPAESDYLFFVVDCETNEAFDHLFSTNYDDHLAKVLTCSQ